MKALRALLFILTIALGHAHACHAVWQLPSGKACEKCPKTQCFSEKAPSEERVVAASDDCRTCCSVTHCEHEGGDTTKTFPVVSQMVLARIEPVLVLPAPPILTHDPISAVVALHLPNAPPASHSARAPPFLLG